MKNGDKNEEEKRGIQKKNKECKQQKKTLKVTYSSISREVRDAIALLKLDH